jgi:ankyrin repeat protein
MVKFLLGYGADINAVSKKSGHSPLFIARYKGYTNIARLLRVKGADIDSIHTAVILGDFMETQKMLQKDIALARSVDKTGATPLHLAAYGGYKDITDLLLACGADINAKDTLGRTPLHFAASKQKIEIAVFLASKGASVDCQDDRKRTPLKEAVSTGNIKLTAKLLACGADHNIKDGKGNTPLTYAASLRRADMVKVLLKGGAKIDTIHDATLIGDIAAVKKMLHAGANINAVDEKGRTPLSLAVRQNNLQMVKFLLARGANGKVKTTRGQGRARHFGFVIAD